MRFRKAVWMPGVFVVFVLALTACGGSDATATPVPTASVSSTANATSQDSASTADSDYLREVLRAERSSLPIFQNFRTIIGQTYPLREALIDALLTAGVGTPFIEKTAILEALDPPEEFLEDHQIWLAASREQLRIDTEAAKAIEDGDLVRFSVLNGQLNGVDVTARISLSPVFCRNIGLAPQQLSICTPDESALSGEYEVAINDLIRKFIPAFAVSQGNIGFRLSLTPEELNQILSETADGTRKLFQEFAAELETISPPDELASDHDRLRTFFGRAIQIATEVYRLGQDNDLEGASGELQKLDPAFCDARASFEVQNFKDAVAIMFAGNESACGGTPF